MLNPDDVQKARLVLVTSGWNDVIKPAILRRGSQALKALAVSRSERAVSFKGTDFDTEDDILRAMIRDAEWMATVWDNEVTVHDANRKLDELEQTSRRTANP